MFTLPDAPPPVIGDETVTAVISPVDVKTTQAEPDQTYIFPSPVL